MARDGGGEQREYAYYVFQDSCPRVSRITVMKKVVQILASIWQLEVSTRFEPMGPKNFFPHGGSPDHLGAPRGRFLAIRSAAGGGIGGGASRATYLP